MDQLPLERFENSRVELLFCQNSLIVFVSLVKSWLLVGRSIDYGILWDLGGVIEIFDQSLLE